MARRRSSERFHIYPRPKRDDYILSGPRGEAVISKPEMLVLARSLVALAAPREADPVPTATVPDPAPHPGPPLCWFCAMRRTPAEHGLCEPCLTHPLVREACAGSPEANPT